MSNELNFDMMSDKGHMAVTVDIETYGVGNDAKIGSIGAVAGNLLTGEVFSDFYVAIDRESQTWRKESKGTLEFWQQQLSEGNTAAHSQLFSDKVRRVVLLEGLMMFNEFVSEMRQIGYQDMSGFSIFGKGPEFDLTIIIDSMESLLLDPCWSFREQQSVRTMDLLAQLTRGKKFKGCTKCELIPHHALDDATEEFVSICKTTNYLKTLAGPNGGLY